MVQGFSTGPSVREGGASGAVSAVSRLQSSAYRSGDGGALLLEAVGVGAATGNVELSAVPAAESDTGVSSFRHFDAE